jgi:hypothetical protein
MKEIKHKEESCGSSWLFNGIHEGPNSKALRMKFSAAVMNR